MTLHTVRFPGESAEYRAARDTLLEAEIELRRRIEEVAALRRRLPAGGVVPVDYEFDDAAGKVKLSQLFRREQASLVVYSFMFGPKMEKACPSCTSILDSLDGAFPHVTQRVNLVVVAKSPLERIQAFARERGWRNLRLLSSAGNTYNQDYHAENAKGGQLPVLNVFSRDGATTVHRFATELLYTADEPGMDGRHVDSMWPLWNVFDFTPEGRGTDWYPKLDYTL